MHNILAFRQYMGPLTTESCEYAYGCVNIFLLIAIHIFACPLLALNWAHMDYVEANMKCRNVVTVRGIGGDSAVIVAGV